ncbi:iron-containing alcohol dehydrogenase [Reinekea sp. G2M2-21]|uniref:iron-containing alcohol dehydrogenase n=1 Tax=Reinekea sp. G2M2-21 TaxID=2788942 RepID=UPI001E3C3ED7|nr:iron-containing alcohol dehydrogenase [Reinekea sp. G2M2-21]
MLFRLYCRFFQFVMRLASYGLPWRQPSVLDSATSLAVQIKAESVSRVFVVSDATIVKLGLMQPLLQALDDNAIRYEIFSETLPNPTIENIEEAAGRYQKKGCYGLLAFGGGAAIDCAKGVGARLARPDKSFAQLRGLLKVRRKLPPFFAVPTTSGTGSEVTLAAVISDSTTHEKYAVNDPCLVPAYALLDPKLTLGLPPSVTATTGMDALTHAVEAYIGRSNTAQTKAFALEAVQLIVANLALVYEQGENLQARANMQRASFLAGLAFTRAYVGYVHAISHALGGLYSVAHGLANAIVLPHVLRAYGKHVYPELAELAIACGIANEKASVPERASKMIAWIEATNATMSIPKAVSELLEEDIPLIVKRSLQEANPLYPVPCIFDQYQMHEVVRNILPGIE